ncbi:MAG: histidine kinase [Prochlorococcus sp. SP3034]|nr:histidine kinase [Prochlorococcus sp. SP3034]|tara:strand:- start:3254 stop:4615 length:1362 start_codon:yes stop_codon:yes gene_type:complete
MKNLISIQFIQDLLLSGSSNLLVDENTSRRMWWCALELIKKEFLSNSYQEGGVWIASPLPTIYEKKYLQKLSGWLFAPEGFPYFNHDYAGYLPHNDSRRSENNTNYISNYKILNLNSTDGYEPFLMIITSKFQCILTIAGEKNKKNFIMRSDHETIQKVIQLLETKLRQENSDEADQFKQKIKEIDKFKLNKEFIDNFWPMLSIRLANLIPDLNFQTPVADHNNKDLQITEAKLLEAISHEVRTPLATIRTLINSTLRKYEMNETIRNRLIQIDNECTEQIDRFGLIFNAAELINGETSLSKQLASIDLGEILNKLSPYWIKQLQRRGITLKIDIPNELPQILSNSEKLELMLGGLIDKNTRGLREGSSLILELRPAGQKIKLQLIVQKKDEIDNISKQIGSDIGPVLNWNPQTGSLQISQSAMHKLLASLGGHVTNRKDTGLTVFFPISERN